MADGGNYPNTAFTVSWSSRGSLQRVLTTALGPSPFTTHFTSFTKTPFAAASIGQVHSAVLRASSSPTGKDERVAVKVQFPDIRASIESDLGYVGMLLAMGGVLPKGLFLDRTIQVRSPSLFGRARLLMSLLAGYERGASR